MHLAINGNKTKGDVRRAGVLAGARTMHMARLRGLGARVRPARGNAAGMKPPDVRGPGVVGFRENPPAAP